MKKIQMFILPSCPYCRKALSYVDQLCQENPQYAAINLTVIDESRERAYANAHDYYLVPTFYVDDKKAHEGVASRETVETVFRLALES